MPLYLVILVLFVLTVFFFSLFYVKSTLGSDQAVHLLFINLIRENGHRFIRNVRTFLIQPKMTYPQLLHWTFSFVPERLLPLLSSILPMTAGILSLSAFLGFIYFVPVGLSSFEIFLAGMLFITTPFTYNINNAKNAGISARGIGLVLGQVYTYGVVLYLFHGNFWFLVVSGISAMLVLMSSQFAAQYILFGSVVMSLLYWSLAPLLPVMGGAALYFMISPGVALQFFTGNYGHKRFYYKYLAEKLLISYRESIWKDVFYEIWRLIFARQKPKGGGTLFMYVYNNPAVILVSSLPLAVPVAVVAFYYKLYSDPSWIWFVPLLTGLILFFLFSFRKTRFLGEPERYVEFSIGVVSIVTVLLSHETPIILYSIIGYQTIMVFAQALVSKKRASVKSKGIMETMKIIDQSIGADENIRLLSNNTEIMRSLITVDRNVFYPSLYSDWYGKFHYPDLYKSFDEMYSDKIIPVIKEFSINRFVLDTTMLARDNFNEIIKNEKLSFAELSSHGPLVSFKVSTLDQHA